MAKTKANWNISLKLVDNWPEFLYAHHVAFQCMTRGKGYYFFSTNCSSTFFFSRRHSMHPRKHVIIKSARGLIGYRCSEQALFLKLFFASIVNMLNKRYWIRKILNTFVNSFPTMCCHVALADLNMNKLANFSLSEGTLKAFNLKYSWTKNSTPVW